MLFLTFQRVSCQPEKGTLYGDQSPLWSAEQGKENKKGEDSWERAPLLVFLQLDCVSEVFSCMAWSTLEIRAGARVDGDIVE